MLTGRVVLNCSSCNRSPVEGALLSSQADLSCSKAR